MGKETEREDNREHLQNKKGKGINECGKKPKLAIKTTFKIRQFKESAASVSLFRFRKY